SSKAGGDKTDSCRGLDDYWIVKIDAFGNKQWDKTYGGQLQDWLFSVRQSMDGGYILGGYSISPISGEKTDSSKGSFDYWIVKVDSLGNKQWDKDFGGTLREEFENVFQTSDTGYLIAGTSYSNASGN